MRLAVHSAAVPLGRRPRDSDGLSLFWLGQAGFLLEWGDLRVLIDPYLSDWLAEDGHGGHFSHVRLMPAPAAPEALRDIDAVLVTHAHPDHMDPGTLPVLQRNNPSCVFIIPRAEAAAARGIGLGEGSLSPVAAGDTVGLGASAEVRVLASAHEGLDTDASGAHLYLGYVLSFGPHVVYHSGDCIPYDGLAAALGPLGVQVCLLPVNGRDEERTSRGIIGNFTLEESIALAQEVRSPFLLGHHFGLFDFNTIDAEAARRRIRDRYPRLAEAYLLVEAGREYLFSG